MQQQSQSILSHDFWVVQKWINHHSYGYSPYQKMTARAFNWCISLNYVQISNTPYSSVPREGKLVLYSVEETALIISEDLGQDIDKTMSLYKKYAVDFERALDYAIKNTKNMTTGLQIRDIDEALVEISPLNPNAMSSHFLFDYLSIKLIRYIESISRYIINEFRTDFFLKFRNFLAVWEKSYKQQRNFLNMHFLSTIKSLYPYNDEANQEWILRFIGRIAIRTNPMQSSSLSLCPSNQAPYKEWNDFLITILVRISSIRNIGIFSPIRYVSQITLPNYLEAHKLIWECLQVATVDNRETIEDMILNVPEGWEPPEESGVD